MTETTIWHVSMSLKVVLKIVHWPIFLPVITLALLMVPLAANTVQGSVVSKGTDG